MAHNYRNCPACKEDFVPKYKQHIYCSHFCKGRYQYICGRLSTENQYKRISGDWPKYLRRLTYPKGREQISIDFLLDLLKKQDYKCALSGCDLTCILGKGMTPFTNASVDRITPGSDYKEGGIRLVCRIANTMKWNMTDAELKFWCQRIVDHGA